MAYFLLKTEPETYSIDDLKQDGTTRWDGIRNFQARKNLQAMKKGDICFIYHTGDEKQVVGLAEIIKEAYPEPNAKEWGAVDIRFEKKFAKPVTLSEIKSTPGLSEMKLVKQARLSVQPVKADEYKKVLKMAEV